MIIGGIFLIAVAFEMVFEHRATRRSATAQTASEDKTLSSIAVFPVAIPLIAGPATITLAILARGDAESGPLHWILPVLPLVLVIAMAGLFMLLSSFIVEKIGQTVSLVLQRLFGLLLGALAIEFVIRGIRDTFGI